MVRLPDAVAKTYKLRKGAPALFAHWKLGDIDVGQLTLEKANELYLAGCTHLVKIQKRTRKVST